MTIGDKVRWIRGAVGLTGTILGSEIIEPAGQYPVPAYTLYRIATPKGTFYEHPNNLERGK